ncbi:MAG: nickel-dependent hydrogenase large subunit [Candidatus Pacebacteria bacterium]|nr:nickel-dependent hydrogenase large subunit [Candidatus Paceibacterota bacterium]
MKIKIDHIAKIEGHAGFVGHIVKGNVTKAQVEIHEGARLIESLLVGRSYEDVPVITSRICGLCPVIHGITSIKALEKAFDITPTKETVILRELMLAGQIIQSQVLHIFFLNATDYFKNRDGLDLAREKPEFVKKVLQLRDFGNNVIKLIGGRSVHPLTPKVGGWHKIPNKNIINQIEIEGKKVLPYSKLLVDFILNLDIPDFQRKTEYIAHKPKEKNKYSSYYGKMNSSEGWVADEEKFRDEIKEQQFEGTVMKLARRNGKSYATDALARLHINRDNLNPMAKKALKSTGLKFPLYNPFYNMLAQTIEVIHYVEECRELVSKLENSNFKNINTDFEIKKGFGSALLEAPRGILYHSYDINDKGIVTQADVMTPTAQLLVNLNDDLKEYLPRIKKYNKKRRELEILKLIHSYDPCISCSTH